MQLNSKNTTALCFIIILMMGHRCVELVQSGLSDTTGASLLQTVKIYVLACGVVLSNLQYGTDRSY